MERAPGFIQIIETHEGDWWVVDDIRVIGVHLADGEDGRAHAHQAAVAQASEVSDNGGYASYGLGIVPRCHVSNFVHGYAGERRGADPAHVCWRGGWFDEDEDDKVEVGEATQCKSLC